jgi:hypothetical protein
MYKFSKSDAWEENNQQAPSSPDHRSWVFTLEKVCALKTIPFTMPLKLDTNYVQMKDKALYCCPRLLCLCYKSQSTTQSPHRLKDFVYHCYALDLSHHDILCHYIHHGNWNTDMSNNVNKQWSFVSCPPEATRAKIGVHDKIPSDLAIYMRQALSRDIWWSLLELINGHIIETRHQAPPSWCDKSQKDTSFFNHTSSPIHTCNLYMVGRRPNIGP